MPRVQNWIDTWRSLAAATGLDERAVIPIPIQIGFTADPAKERHERPLFWIERDQLEAGPLEIHKLITRTGRKAGVVHWRAAPKLTLDLIAEKISADPATATSAVAEILTRAILHEFRIGSFYDYKAGHDAGASLRACFGDAAKSPWRSSMRALGPDNAFLGDEDLAAIIGPVKRQVSDSEFARVILAAQKRLFDRYSLIAPDYVAGVPASIAKDYAAWQAGRDAQERARIEAGELAAETAEQRRRDLLPAEMRDQEFTKLDWSSVTPDELQAQLNLAPSTHVAVIYGVSSSLIRKRAEQWKLTLQPRSHWYRERAAGSFVR